MEYNRQNRTGNSLEVGGGEEGDGASLGGRWGIERGRDLGVGERGEAEGGVGGGRERERASLSRGQRASVAAGGRGLSLNRVKKYDLRVFAFNYLL